MKACELQIPLCYQTFFKCVNPSCQHSLLRFAVSALNGLGPRAVGSLLSSQKCALARFHPDPAVLCLFSQAVGLTTETQRI